MTHAEIEKTPLVVSDALRCYPLYVPATRRTSERAWFDVFALSETCFAVSIGNVAGAGGDSAAIVRAIRRTFGPSDVQTGPKKLLLAADAMLREAASAATFATAIVGIIDSTEQTFTYVSAGHPPPFMRFADGSVSALPADGLPIGLIECEYPPAQVVVDLRAAGLVLLYSSMVVHATKNVSDGLERLRHVLADDRLAHCSSPAAWIARRMLADTSHAEAALLALTFPPRPHAESGPPPAGVAPRWTVSWSFDSKGAASLGARHAFLGCLNSKHTGVPIDLAAAELIFGELLGNVVRHAPGPVEISLDWTDTLPVLHVLDNGPGFRSRRKRERLPVDDWSESGRGLFIVNACAVSFTVRNRHGRGTHASATLPPA
jgi:hypothetical protein